MSERSSPDLIQIAILVLLTINLALTAALWLTRANEGIPQSPARAELPKFADAAELSRLADDIKALYNARDVEGLYELFDDLAKVQITPAQLAEQLGSFDSVIGKIDSFAYSHFETNEVNGHPVYILNYAVRLDGGHFQNGTLKVTVVDRSGNFRLFGFNLFGGTTPL